MSQGEKRVLIPAGAEGFPVRAQGDFIFVRACSFPIRVIVDGQPITMEAGEKRVFKRKNPIEMAFSDFQVDNLSTVAQQVTFITGEGDFEKIIVSGELNVSAYVNTATFGVSKSLPMETTKTVGIDDLTPRTINAGTEVTNTGAQSGAVTQAAFYFDGSCYGIDHLNIYRFTEATAPGTVDETLPLSNMASFGITATNNNAVYGAVADKNTGNVYFFGGFEKYLYKFSIGSRAVSRVSLTPLMSSQIAYGRGLGLVGRELVAYDKNLNGADGVGGDGRVGSLVFWNIDTNEKRTVPLQNVPGKTYVDIGYIAPDGNFHICGAGTSNRLIFSLDGTYLGEENGWISSGLHGGFLPDGVNSITRDTGNTGWAIKAFKQVQVAGSIFVQDGADTSTRKIIYLDSAPNYYPKNSGAVVVGQILTSVMKYLNPAKSFALDFVTSFKFSDGNAIRKYDSGTQSFALRGFVDNFPVFLDSEVTVGFLPEFFE